MNGTLSFFNGAPSNLGVYAASQADSALINRGSYIPQVAGGGAGDLTAPFVNTQANGTWILRVMDYRPGNTGGVSGAVLRISTIARSATTSCVNAKSALTAAMAFNKKASASFAKARSKFKKVQINGSNKVVAKRKAALKAARAVSQAAAAQLAAATRTKTDSC